MKNTLLSSGNAVRLVLEVKAGPSPLKNSLIFGPVTYGVKEAASLMNIV
jgi:hypothetical protein